MREVLHVVHKERIDDHVVRGVPYQAHLWGQKVRQHLLEHCIFKDRVLVIEAQVVVFVPFSTRLISCMLALFLFFPRAKCKVSCELLTRFQRFDSFLFFLVAMLSILHFWRIRSNPKMGSQFMCSPGWVSWKIEWMAPWDAPTGALTAL